MIHELRIYTTHPGKMPALLDRFRNHTLRIWERLGIRTSEFWTSATEPDNNELTYFIVWQDMAEREAKWPIFQADPEWLAARAASEATGSIVVSVASSFLKPAGLSAAR